MNNQTCSTLGQEEKLPRYINTCNSGFEFGDVPYKEDDDYDGNWSTFYDLSKDAIPLTMAEYKMAQKALDDLAIAEAAVHQVKKSLDFHREVNGWIADLSNIVLPTAETGGLTIGVGHRGNFHVTFDRDYYGKLYFTARLPYLIQDYIDHLMMSLVENPFQEFYFVSDIHRVTVNERGRAFHDVSMRTIRRYWSLVTKLALCPESFLEDLPIPVPHQPSILDDIDSSPESIEKDMKAILRSFRKDKSCPS